MEKFIKKLNPRLKAKIFENVTKVKQGEFSEVKFKKLKNYDDLYRLRVEWVRVILKRINGTFEVVDIVERKDVYRRL